MRERSTADHTVKRDAMAWQTYKGNHRVSARRFIRLPDAPVKAGKQAAWLANIYSQRLREAATKRFSRSR